MTTPATEVPEPLVAGVLHMKGTPMPEFDELLAAAANFEEPRDKWISDFMPPTGVAPPTDFDPINPTPIMLMSVGPEPPKPVCQTLGCPHGGGYGCINEGFCDDEYMLYHERPHIWQGDYS